MSSPQKKKNVLQMMSACATMRFELRNPEAYLKQTKIKKTPFTRFNKSQPKNTPQPQHQKHKPSQNHETNQEVGGSVEGDCGFSLKFLQKLSDDTILVGNQYQLDMLKVGGIYDDFIQVQYKWSLQPQSAISSISIEHKYGFIATGGGKTLEIRKYNFKRENQFPKLLIKTNMNQNIHQIRFAKNLGLFLIFQQQIQFHRLSIINDQLQINGTFVHKFDYGPNFKLYLVPQTIQNSLNLYFYQNKVKKQQTSKFGLWMQTIEAKANIDTPTMGKLTLIYNINVKQRNQFRIYNYSKDFCLIKFTYNIIAVKNGYIIDQAFTNFRKENSFIEYVEQSHNLIHYRDQYIDVYKLSMNMDVKPQKIALECVDSFKFLAPQSSLFYRIICLKPEQFAIFYQKPATNLGSQPQLQYSFSVSYEVDLKKKIDRMYLKDVEIQNSMIQDLSDKCQEAYKFGMTNQQAFYQLWKRSKKTSLLDFQILIGTKDFKTIQRQVQKKLTKQSMSIREIIKIYTESLLMLRQRVLSPECKVENLIQYASCHFLLKKFELYRFLCNQQKKEIELQRKRQLECKLIERMHSGERKSESHWLQQSFYVEQSQFQRQSQQVLLISIKEFKQYSEMQVMNKLVDLICSYLQKKVAFTMKKIKAILSFFKLIFKVYYMETIQTIIKLCKVRILQIIAELPELFPYHYQEESLGLGLWTQTTQEEIDQYVFLNQLVTLDNKAKVQEFSRHIWFKRNKNTSHGVIVIPKQEFQQFIQQNNNYEAVFYRIFYHFYGLRTYNQCFKKLIFHIQTRYKLLPPHLNGTFQLYIFLYEMFQNINREYTFQTFLKYKEFQLFKMYFQREKIEKNGFILKKVMPLYHKLLRNGCQVFNQGIFNYFSVEESSVADLKCILNKLNNEKNEFHITAQKLYEVLIEAVMIKMKIGSSCDTPIEEILVYIENIPFPIHNESIMTNLQYIQEINYQSEILRTIKVNMSLQQVVDNPNKVIQMMVEYEIDRHRVHEIKEYRSFKVHAYKILAEVQCRKSNIYGDKQHKHSLKFYIIKLMKTVQKIALCSKLLNDAYLVEEFGIDTELIEQIVLTLYHWRISNIVEEQDKYFLTHRQYLQKLSELLAIGNRIKCFVQLSIKYAELLSFEDGFRIQYPIFSIKEAYPTLNDFVQTVSCLRASQLAQLNLEAIFKTIMNLKKLRETEIKNSQYFIKYQKKLKVQVYEHVIVHLISMKQLKAAIQKTFTLFTLENEYPEFNIIFPALIIEQLLPELLQNSSLLIIKLLSYYYYSPFELTQIIKYLFSRPFSNQEIDNYLNLKLEQKSRQLAMTVQNPIIAQKLKLIGSSIEDNCAKINQFIEWTLNRVIASSDIFHKNYPVYIMYRLMCHNPIVISKWIWCKKKGINIKMVRSVISFMSLEKVFDSQGILQCGRKIFQIIRFKYTHSAFFNEIIKHKDRLEAIQLNETGNNPNSQEEEHVIKMLTDSIELFLLKISSLKDSHIEIIQQKEKTNYQLLILNPDRYHSRPRSQYIYDDLDDGYEKANDFLLIGRTKKHQASAVSDRNSDHSEKPINSLNSLMIPQKGRGRKYSEYFPEIIDFQPKTISKENVNSLSQLRSEGQQKQSKMSYKFKQDVFENKIVEDAGDMMDSGVHSTVNIAKKFSKQQRGEEEKEVKQRKVKAQRLQYLKQLYSQVSSKKSAWNDKMSVQSQQMEQFQLDYQNSSAQFNFKVTQAVVIKFIPVDEMAEKLIQNNSAHSESMLQLKSYSGSQKFLVYLTQILQYIYAYKLVEFERRLKTVLEVAHLFEFQYFSTECNRIFQKLLQYSLDNKLPKEIQQIVPIDVLLQTDIEEAFQLFLSKTDGSLNMLNISETIELVAEIFNSGKKDELIVAFIVSQSRKHFVKGQSQKYFAFLLPFINQFENRKFSIEKLCLKLRKQGQIDQEVIKKISNLNKNILQQKI